MTARERWNASVRMEPVDRLLFWPKLDDAYCNKYNQHYGFTNIKEYHSFIGSDSLEFAPECIEDSFNLCSVEIVNKDNQECKQIFTPYGNINSINQFDEDSQAWHPVEYPIKTKEDLKLMTSYYQDIVCKISRKNIADVQLMKSEFNDSIFLLETVGESPLMHFVEYLAGIANAHYFLHDYQVEVELLFDSIQNYLLMKTEAVCRNTAADMVYFIENTSTTLISPLQYRQYCLPHIQAYADICNSNNTILCLHMCGHLKGLLPDLNNTGANVFEAFTSPTIGNTKLIDGRTACPNISIIGGTNANLWLDSAEEIISEIEEDLEALPHHRGIIVSSGGVMPPACSPDTIKKVDQRQLLFPVDDNYNSRLQFVNAV